MPTSFTWAPFLASLALFTATHWIVLRWIEPDFKNAFKLSRGVAAVLLTAIGLVALLASLEHWRTVFVYRHAHDDWMRVAFLWVYGHFVSDFLWMVFGRLALKAPVRQDLVVHHLLGVIAFAFAFVLQVGYALGLIVMISEVLPISTGLNGLGHRLRQPRLSALATRSHFHLLMWVRLPLWLVLLTLSCRVLLAGNADELALAYQIVTAGLLMLVALDVFWIWDCLRRKEKAV